VKRPAVSAPVEIPSFSPEKANPADAAVDGLKRLFTQKQYP
jgi:hypothetical protein